MMTVISRLWLMGIQACVPILLVLTVRFFLKRYPKKYTFWLWMLVGIRLLCPIWVESPLKAENGWGLSEKTAAWAEQAVIFQEALNQSEEKYAQDKRGVSKETVGPGEIAGIEELMAAEVPETEMAAGRSENPKVLSSGETDILRSEKEHIGKAELLAVLYLVGTAMFCGRYLMQYLLMKRSVRTAVRQKGEVWLCENIRSPFVMGIFRSRIFMPYGLEGEYRSFVLQHERMHIRHHDPLIRLTGVLCVCLHWWNPLVWLAVRRMNQDMEMLCDEAVLRNSPLEKRKRYARALLLFAERQNGLTVGLAIGESDTKRRVKNLMHRRKGNVLLICIAAAAALLCLGAFFSGPESRKNVPGKNAVKKEGNKTGDETGEKAQDGNTRMAFAGALEELRQNHVFPSREVYECPDENLGKFAVYDVDMDGREELVLLCDNTYMAGMVGYVFGYEEKDGTLQEELAEFPGLTFYDNGACTATWSHNQGLAGDFWPYTVYQYRSEADSYEKTGMVDAWEKAVFPTDNEGNPFPDEIDTSGSGFVYYLMKDTYETTNPVDVSEYEKWAGEYIGNAKEIALPYMDITEENIRKICPEFVRKGEDTSDSQTFEVEFPSLGTVTFIAAVPDTDRSPYADMKLQLRKGNEVVYDFSPHADEPRPDEWVFQELAAVSFPDLNGDGYKDVVTIADYQCGTTAFRETRIFTGKPDGSFQEEIYLEEAFNESQETQTVADLKTFVSQEDNRDYFVGTSLYGHWLITGYEDQGISALSREEKESCVGSRLEYGRYYFGLESEKRQAVSAFKKETVTKEELQKAFGVSAEEPMKSAENFRYYEAQGNLDSLFGAFFYQADAEHAWIYYEGVFFRAIRE